MASLGDPRTSHSTPAQDGNPKPHVENETGFTQRLLIAAENGNLEELKLCIERQVDINTSNSEGATPLWLAINHNHDEAIRFLLERGANVNVKNPDGETPLYWAVDEYDMKTIRLLLDQKADVNTPNDNGDFPLHRAVYREKKDVVRLLLEHGANVNDKGTDGTTPLHQAVCDGQEPIVRLLLDQNAEVNTLDQQGDFPLYRAVNKENEAIVRLLLDHGATLNDKAQSGMTPLSRAVRDGQLAIVKLLLDRKANINIQDDDGESSLYQAIYKGNELLARLLLEHGANVNDGGPKGRKPLHVAVLGGEEAIVKLLLDWKADSTAQDDYGESPLHVVAAYRSNAGILKLLLSRSSNINDTNANGETPLYRAFAKGNIESIQLLLENQATFQAKDPDKSVELSFHVYMGHRDVVEELLKDGADIEGQNEEDMTALHWAVAAGSQELVNLLLERGANVIAKDDKSMSPLHYASRFGNEATVELLLAYGADVTSTDDLGLTGLHWAARTGRKEVVQLLLKKGADIESKDRSGLTALHWASQEERVTVAELLLIMKAAIEMKTDSGMTALHLAAREGKKETTTLLLDRGAAIEAKEDEGKTALHLAAVMGKAEIARLLLERLADVESRTSSGWTALHLASEEGHTEVMEVLFSHKADIEARQQGFSGATPLLLASSEDHPSAVTSLLKNGANVNARDDDGWTAIHWAANWSQAKVADVLLGRMSDEAIEARDDGGDTALHFATRENSEAVVELLSKRMDEDALAMRNTAGQTAFSIAAEGGDRGVLQILVNHRADLTSKEGVKSEAVVPMTREEIDSVGEALLGNMHLWKDSTETRLKTLHWSARNGHLPILEKMLELFPKILRDTTQDTVLYWAAIGGQKATVEFLIEKLAGNDPEATLNEDDAKEALNAAARNGNDDIVGRLLRKMRAPKPDEETKNWTPLHWAADYKETKIVRLMLRNSADPEAKSNISSVVDLVKAMAEEMNRDLKTSGQVKTARMALENVQSILDLLENPLRFPPKPPRLREPEQPPNKLSKVYQKITANITDFYALDGLSPTVERQRSISEVVYGLGPEKIMSRARDNWDIPAHQHRFRWIHLPANNWIWLEDLMQKTFCGSKKSDKEYFRLQNFVRENRRDREHLGKPHSRFMYSGLRFERKDFDSGDGASSLYSRSQQRSAKKEKQGRRENLPKAGEQLKAERQGKDDKQTAGANEKDAGADRAVQLNAQNPGARGDLLKEDGKAGRKEENEEPKGQSAQQPPTKGELKTEKPGRERERPADIDEVSHLEGCKVAICIPFLTLGTVQCQKQMQKAICLAEEIHGTPQITQSNGMSIGDSTAQASSPEEEHPVINADDEPARMAKMRILAHEIVNVEALLRIILEDDRSQGLVDLLKAVKSAKDDFSATLGLPRDDSVRAILSPYEIAESVNGNKASAGAKPTNPQGAQDIIEDGKDKPTATLKALDSLKSTIEATKPVNIPLAVFEPLERLRDAIEIFTEKGQVSEDAQLLRHFVHPKYGNDLHVTRTLDQYYYPSLCDTRRRDGDQVVRRYQDRLVQDHRLLAKNNGDPGKGTKDPGQSTNGRQRGFVEFPSDLSSKDGANKPRIKGSSHGERLKSEGGTDEVKICMVDQLWLWIIDDKTIITCFPEAWGQGQGHGLLSKIRSHIQDEVRPQIYSVYHMAVLIMSICSDFIESCPVETDQGPEPLLHTFASSIGIVADKEVKCFEEFKRMLSVRKSGRQKRGESSSSKLELDLLEEIKLLQEIKDIKDELNILQNIFEDQKEALDNLLGLILRDGSTAKNEGIAKNPILNYYRERSNIDIRLERIKNMQGDASTTYDALNHLLDLKQKDANILEASEARIRADETAKQGVTILVFTVVTIIFLPMSFLASLFALNVDSFPHDSGNLSYPSQWIFSRIFGTTAAIAVPLVLIAVYIIKFLEVLKRFWNFVVHGIEAAVSSNGKSHLQGQEVYSKNDRELHKSSSYASGQDLNQKYKKTTSRPQNETNQSVPSWRSKLRREKSSSQDPV